MSIEDPIALASEIEAEIRGLKDPVVPKVRAIRRAYSRRLRTSEGELVLAVARHLYGTLDARWVALELIRYHEPALSLISEAHLREFGERLDSWGAVDAFAGFLAGPAWLRGQIPDELIRSWARSDDRWWRRAALVSTVVLNTPSHGGKGDAPRTLAICKLLVKDRDDMVVKALSWALRKLVPHNEQDLRRFMKQHEGQLAARVVREVNNKLSTGLKNPKSPSKGRTAETDREVGRLSAELEKTARSL